MQLKNVGWERIEKHDSTLEKICANHVVSLRVAVQTKDEPASLSYEATLGLLTTCFETEVNSNRKMRK